MRHLLIIALTLIPILIHGQNRHLTIGCNDNGIIIGNSKKSNGLRLNLWDRDIDTINGLSISGLSESAKTNGISLGLIANFDSTINGISIGGLTGGSRKINGVALGGLGAGGGTINGLGIAGLGVTGDTLNGLFCGLFGCYYCNADPISRINGVTFGFLTGSVAREFNGLSVGVLFNDYSNQKGVAIAAYNKTSELHGFQFGLLNYAGNNKKLFRWLPLMNFNLRKKASR